MFVFDTCALYWWTVSPEKLSRKASARCKLIAERGAKVCSVSLWELGMKAKRTQIDLGCSIREYHRRLASVQGLDIVAVNAELWIASLELEWTHRDPADRLIVALAQLHNLSILTADTEIRDWYPDIVEA